VLAGSLYFHAILGQSVINFYIWKIVKKMSCSSLKFFPESSFRLITIFINGRKRLGESWQTKGNIKFGKTMESSQINIDAICLSFQVSLLEDHIHRFKKRAQIQEKKLNSNMCIIFV
jgi:hypothetical protein